MLKPSAASQIIKCDKPVLIRFYDPGVPPVPPNSYQFATLAAITGVQAEIIGLLDCGVAKHHLTLLDEQLRPFGVEWAYWDHDGKRVAHKVRAATHC